MSVDFSFEGRAMCLTLFTWFRFLKVKELQFGTPSNPLISEAPYSSNLIFNGWNWGFSSLHNHYSLISHFNSNNSIIIVVVAVICLKWLTFSGYDKLFLQILYSVGWNSNLLCSEMEFILMVFMVNRSDTWNYMHWIVYERMQCNL